MTRRTFFPRIPALLALGTMMALLLAGTAFTPLAAQNPDLGWTQTRWRPDPNRALAVLQGETIDQQTVYLWQLANGRDPLAARIPEIGLDRPSVRQPLEDAVRDYAVALLLSRDAGTVPSTSIDPAGKAARIYSGDAALLTYADLMIAPGVRVAPADVRHFYRTNPDLFIRPARVEVLELLLPVNPAQGDAAFQSALSRAAQLRAEAIAGNGLLPVLEANPELSTRTPIGRTRVIRQGDAGISPELWATLAGLRISQITEPVRNETSVVLYEVVQRTPERRRALEDVYTEIVRILERRSFRTQLDVAIARKRDDARPLSQMNFYHLLEPEMTLLRVRGFSLTRGEFDTIFPSLAGGSDRETQRARAALADHIIRGEVMAQALEQERLLAAPMYQRALAVGRIRARADVRARALEQEFQLGDEDVRAFLDANRQRFAPDRTRFIWQLEFAPSESTPLSVAERDRLAVEGMELLAGLARDGARLIEERAAITGPVAYSSPQLVLNRLLPTDPDLPYVISFRQAGELTPWEGTQRGAPFANWQVGTFTQALPQPNGRVIMYYAADEVEQDAPPMARQLSAARAAMLVDAGRFAARQRLEDLERTGSFSFRF